MANKNDHKHSTTNKTRKTKNALIHGLYSSDLVMPWELREEFEKLHADLCMEFSPNGPMEQETVLDLACLRWQKQRVRKMWLAATYNDPFAIELIETGEKSFSGIRRHLRRQARDTHTMIGSIHAVFSELANQARKVSRALSEEGAKKDDIERAQNELGALLSMMQERVLPLTRSLEEGPNAEQTLGKAYSPEYLEPILRLEAMLDARIDKALGRLVSLKTYKRLNAEPAMLTAPNHDLSLQAGVTHDYKPND